MSPSCSISKQEGDVLTQWQYVVTVATWACFLFHICPPPPVWTLTLLHSASSVSCFPGNCFSLTVCFYQTDNFTTTQLSTIINIKMVSSASLSGFVTFQWYIHRLVNHKSYSSVLSEPTFTRGYIHMLQLASLLKRHDG